MIQKYSFFFSFEFLTTREHYNFRSWIGAVTGNNITFREASSITSSNLGVSTTPFKKKQTKTKPTKKIQHIICPGLLEVSTGHLFQSFINSLTQKQCSS